MHQDFSYRGLALTLAFCACLSALLLSHRSEAASFLLRRCLGAREKLICADPDLSRADEKLAATYK